MRLIDADALVYTMLYGGTGCTPLMLTPKTIAEAPTVDAVEVVRCEKCMYFKPFINRGGWGKCELNDDGEWSVNDFCSYGEKGD